MIALAVVTTVLINAGRGRYAAGDDPADAVRDLHHADRRLPDDHRPVHPSVSDGWRVSSLGMRNWGLVVKGGLNIGLTLFMMAAVTVILLQAITRWLNRAFLGVIGRSMRIALRPLHTPLAGQKMRRAFRSAR